jgi:hypothetical protein
MHPVADHAEYLVFQSVLEFDGPIVWVGRVQPDSRGFHHQAAEEEFAEYRGHDHPARRGFDGAVDDQQVAGVEVGAGHGVIAQPDEERGGGTRYAFRQRGWST